MQEGIQITIAICTRDRATLLKRNLNELVVPISPNKDRFEIIVVDNASNDGTALCVSLFKKDNPDINVSYSREDIPGLSRARNKAVDCSKGEWIFFLDDDMFLYPDVIEHSLDLVSKPEFDVYGGYFEGLWEKEKPCWVPEGELEPAYPRVHEIKQMEDHHFAYGGIMLVKRELFVKVGSFDPALGLKGKVRGYGEETDWQIRAKAMGFSIAYAHLIRGKHLINDSKYSLYWNLMDKYQRMKYFELMNHSKLRMTSLLQFIKQLVVIIPKMLVASGRFVSTDSCFKRELYYLLTPLFLVTGTFVGQLKNTMGRS